MANTKQIQTRIGSMKDIMKITNAMYMISSSKIKKAQRQLVQTEIYSRQLEHNINAIIGHMPDFKSHYFVDEAKEKPEEEKRRGYIVITADKGMAGAYNHNVIKLAMEEISKPSAHYIFSVGQVGRNYFLKIGKEVDLDFQYTVQNPSIHRARVITEEVMEFFQNHEIDEIFIVYTSVGRGGTCEAHMKRLLPLKRSDFRKDDEEINMEHVEFYPEAHDIFRRMIPNYITGFIYGALVESFCSEHTARVAAMESATDNAKEMIKDLSVAFNRARQGAITQEISEVSSGAQAQKKSKMR